MELKRRQSKRQLIVLTVLIVPSGIEATTALKISVDTDALIVPLLYKQIKETITIFCFCVDHFLLIICKDYLLQLLHSIHTY